MAQPNYFNAPIPGQSLTQDPASAGPWERPPKFTTVNEALDHLFSVVTSKAYIKNLDKLLAEDKRFYVDELAAGMLTEGFINGLWTVDVMTLLAEPLIILLVWAAAQMDRSVSFSGDTGDEDRTGFGEMDGMYSAIEMPTEEETTPTPQEAPQQPQSPLAAGPQSPLVTGGAL